MVGITYRELKIEECERIREIDASQFIGRAWREVNGERKLVEINYQDPDWPNGYGYHVSRLKETIQGKGCAIGAFDEKQTLIGLVTVNRGFFGQESKYVLLDQLFISLEYRNKGIGKNLFFLSADVAKQWNADKIYICAGSAEETIAFYFAVGCVEAAEINRQLYENDPRDFQLEFNLHNEAKGVL
ncbi:MAG: putative acetyltransferase [Bacillales bacterium]|nr:putative acetyltransferase [Bacillales bacterium]